MGKYKSFLANEARPKFAPKLALIQSDRARYTLAPMMDHYASREAPCDRLRIGDLAAAIFLDGAGPQRFAKPLPPFDHWHWLVALAPDRHDGGAVRGPLPLVPPTRARRIAPFLLSGLTLWGFVMAVVTQGCHCFFQGESYIRQHPAPLAIYPLRTTLGAGFHFLLGLAIAIVFVWIVNGMGNVPALLSLIPTLLLLFLVGWSLAVCMGVANVVFQDSQHLIDVVMQILFYVTPIIYKTDRLADRRRAWPGSSISIRSPFSWSWFASRCCTASCRRCGPPAWAL